MDDWSEFPAVSKDDPWAEFPTAKSGTTPKPSATTLDRANAGAAGVNEGVADLIGLPMNTAANVVDLGKAALGTAYSKITGKAVPEALQVDSDRSGTPLTSEWLKAHMGTTVVAPRPDDLTSSLLNAGGKGVVAGAVGAATGAPVVPSILSGIAGSEASQVTAEAGGGPLAQTAAGLIGAITPSGVRVGSQAALRAAARGGEEGRLATAQNAQTFENAGTEATVGQATGSRTMQATESLMAKLPGSAGVMDAKAAAEQNQIGANVERQAANLSPAASPEAAGRAINRGISGPGGFIENFRATSGQLYNVLDQHIPQNTPVTVRNTQAALHEMTTPIQGAENSSAILINPRLNALAEGLQADTVNGGQVPYLALQRLRTMVGREIDNGVLQPNFPAAEWRRLYGALSTDMGEAAQAAGPDAVRAFERANNFYRAGSQRVEMLEQVVGRNGGPEKVFSAATDGTKQGATVIRSVMRSLPLDAQQAVSATVLRRLGTPTPGQATANTSFSTNTFLTNWNKMNAGARSALFDNYAAGFRENLDAIARAAGYIREGSKVFSNPARTSHGVAQVSAAGAFFGALASGHLGVAAGVAGGVAGANLGARIMTNPNAVRFLARTTRASASAVPALVNQIAQSPDPDLHELGELMQSQ